MRKREREATSDSKIWDLNNWKDGDVTSKMRDYKGTASLERTVGSGFAYVKFKTWT